MISALYKRSRRITPQTTRNRTRDQTPGTSTTKYSISIHAGNSKQTPTAVQTPRFPTHPRNCQYYTLEAGTNEKNHQRRNRHPIQCVFNRQRPNENIVRHEGRPTEIYVRLVQRNRHRSLQADHRNQGAQLAKPEKQIPEFVREATDHQRQSKPCAQ